MTPSLYLIPVPISDSEPALSLPAPVIELLNRIDFFIVENIRTARRFIKRAMVTRSFDGLTFFTLDKHTDDNDLGLFLEPVKAGHSIGLMSEAGIPAVADPGASLIRLAHKLGINVKPLPGPSSILLALAASGMNGQCFAFNGYLPINKSARINALKILEERAYRENQTQIFMETPYRNMALLNDLLHHCKPGTELCIAADITGEKEMIQTCTVSTWKNRKPDIHKIPAVFLISRP